MVGREGGPAKAKLARFYLAAAASESEPEIKLEPVAELVSATVSS
jgi:hypothetical protein